MQNAKYRAGVCPGLSDFLRIGLSAMPQDQIKLGSDLGMILRFVNSALRPLGAATGPNKESEPMNAAGSGSEAAARWSGGATSRQPRACRETHSKCLLTG